MIESEARNALPQLVVSGHFPAPRKRPVAQPNYQAVAHLYKSSREMYFFLGASEERKTSMIKLDDQ